MGFNAKTCPISAEFVRAFRAEFGEDVQVISIHENGFDYGPQDKQEEDDAES